MSDKNAPLVGSIGVMNGVVGNGAVFNNYGSMNNAEKITVIEGMDAVQSNPDLMAAVLDPTCDEEETTSLIERVMGWTGDFTRQVLAQLAATGIHQALLP